MASHIDFRFLKDNADFLQILEHYDLSPTGKGVSRAVLCPFHTDKTPSLKINLGRRIWQCFGCGAKGNALDFVRRMEGLPEDELRAAARKLADICSLPLVPPTGGAVIGQKRPKETGSGPETIEKPSDPVSRAGEAPSASLEGSDNPARNEPLAPDFIERFRAKLEAYHPWLEHRGISPALAQAFELGFCPPETKSMMKGRVVIPIHDEEGELLAWAGRYASDEKLPEGQGKYLLPKGFHKQLVLYNLHRVLGRKHLVLVEGFFSVMRLHALGVPAVALMGCSLSDEQIALLRQAGVRYLTILLDGDEAGRSAALAMMERLAGEAFLVKFALLPDGTEPDTVDEAVLHELLRLRS